MRHSRAVPVPCRVRLCRFPLLLGLLLAAMPVLAQSPHLRVQSVIRQFVEATGYEVVGLGSWIEGRTYNPRTSDHDLRLVLPTGATSPDRKWLEAREQLARMIRAEFGDDAASVLSRTNLYPPSQLMGAVDDIDDAAWVFTKNGAVPNLGHSGPVTRNTPIKELSEGLYGEGSRAFTQYYESAKGRLFYKAPNGRCIMGMTDLTHFSEGVRTFTVGGSANTAIQWVEHAIEECAHGRGDKVAKYLERIERDLLKSRDLARLPTSNALRGQLKSMRELLKANPGRLADVSDDVARLLSQAATEASVLKSYGSAGPMGRMYQRVILEGLETGSEVGRVVRKAYGAVKHAMPLDRFITLMTVAQTLYYGGLAKDEAGWAAAIKAAGPAAVGLASLPASLLLEMTAAIMKEAEASGYEMAAASQEPWDLMAGLYTALGRKQDEQDPRRRLTLDALVRGWPVEARLSSLVYGQCIRACRRDVGEAGGVAEDTDWKVADAMYRRCWPVIRDAWRWQRDQYVAEYLELAADALHTPMLLSYEPCPIKYAGKPIKVSVNARSRDRKFGAKLDRMQEILKILCGKSAFLAEHWDWQPQGAPENMTTADVRRVYTFNKPGTHSVVLAVRFEAICPDAQPPDAHRVLLERVNKTAVDVVVETDAPVLTKPTGDVEYYASPQSGWKPISTDAASLSQYVQEFGPRGDYLRMVWPWRDQAGRTHQPYGIELVRDSTTKLGGVQIGLRTHGYLVVGPQMDKRPSQGQLPASARPMTIGDTAGRYAPEYELYLPTQAHSKFLERGYVLKRVTAWYLSSLGELDICGGVSVEITQGVADAKELKNLQAAIEPAFQQAVRDMEATFATARLVRE